MEAARHPAEAKRVEVLRSYDILDTPQEEEFDEIVRVVSAICEVPISVINLIDGDRQWFKAEVGLGVRETPLPASICAHAILQPDLFEVPDTHDDARFSDNPLVTGNPHLRFYAGALLESPEKLPLGTICVLDYKPRQLTDNQRALLRLMASQIMKMFELRRVNAQEHSARKRAEFLLDENRTLARESDHRVMNSLQLVSSVLGLQSRNTADAHAKEQIAAAQSRVGAIATVHKQLHLAGSLEQVELGQFLRGLSEGLKPLAPSAVTDMYVHADPMQVRSDLASTIGLVVAELVANSFKYAFPDDKTGAVKIAFRVHDGWQLSVSDEGVGLPEGFKIGSSGGIGMKVISALVRRLDAKLSFSSSPAGATFTVIKRD